MIENQQDKLETLEKLLSQKRSKAFYASKLGITEKEVQDLLDELNKKESLQEDSQGITQKVNVDKGTLESSIEVTYEPKSVEELAILHKVDLSKYKISQYWSKLKPSGKFTSSIFCSLKSSKDYTLEDFCNFLKNYTPPKVEIVSKYKSEYEDKQEIDVELNIADFHLAKKTIQGDTLDSKTFDYYKTINGLINKVCSNYSINKIVFPISNDFFHSDNYQNTTTNGTPQDVTGWFDEEYEKGFTLLANSISFLSTQCKELEIILVQGNHDRTKGFYVAHALEVFFKEEKHIKFKRNHSVTKSTVLGNTFIGYHHGNSCKLEELPLLFATGENSEAFGKARYREIHTGDKHHYMAKEIKGVRIQQMPSLSGTDRWHLDNGYINQIRAALALVYHPIYGKICEFESRL